MVATYCLKYLKLLVTKCKISTTRTWTHDATGAGHPPGILYNFIHLSAAIKITYKIIILINTHNNKTHTDVSNKPRTNHLLENNPRTETP